MPTQPAASHGLPKMVFPWKRGWFFRFLGAAWLGEGASNPRQSLSGGVDQTLVLP